MLQMLHIADNLFLAELQELIDYSPYGSYYTKSGKTKETVLICLSTDTLKSAISIIGTELTFNKIAFNFQYSCSSDSDNLHSYLDNILFQIKDNTKTNKHII